MGALGAPSGSILWALVFVIVVVLALRELACWYWKLNKLVSIQEEQTRILRTIRDEIKQTKEN